MRLAKVATGSWMLVASLVQGSPAAEWNETQTTWRDLVARLFTPGQGDKVPGTSTMWHCKGTGSNDIATLNFVDMAPKVLTKYAPVCRKDYTSYLAR